jgi:hypothetical protein
MYYLYFAALLIIQLIFCGVELNADTLDLIVIGFLTVVAGGVLALDLSRKA